MRQVKVLFIGFLVAVALAVTLHAQNYVWSSINGVPYGPGVVLASGSAANPSLNFGGFNTGWSGNAGSLVGSVSGTQVAQFGITNSYLNPTNLYLSATGTRLGWPIVAVTTTQADDLAQTGTVYTNQGDADGAAVTLPGAYAGVTFTSCIQTAQTLTITANTGDTIRLASGVTAAAGSISSNVIGSCVTLVAINATEWYATSIVGSWSY